LRINDCIPLPDGQGVKSLTVGGRYGDFEIAFRNMEGLDEQNMLWIREGQHKVCMMGNPNYNLYVLAMAAASAYRSPSMSRP
jgi:hypothetical protein